MLSSNIRENLRILRKEHNGMTQSELAEKIGVSGQMIQKWETGLTKDIPLDYVVKIAKVFHISCDELITGIKPENASAAEDLKLSDYAIDELRMGSAIPGIINTLLDPRFSYSDGIPIGQQILLLIDDCINRDYIVCNYPVGMNKEGKELKMFVHSSQITLMQIGELMDIMRNAIKRRNSNEKGKR